MVTVELEWVVHRCCWPSANRMTFVKDSRLEDLLMALRLFWEVETLAGLVLAQPQMGRLPCQLARGGLSRKQIKYVTGMVTE